MNLDVKRIRVTSGLQNPSYLSEGAKNGKNAQKRARPAVFDGFFSSEEHKKPYFLFLIHYI